VLSAGGIDAAAAASPSRESGTAPEALGELPLLLLPLLLLLLLLMSMLREGTRLGPKLVSLAVSKVEVLVD
jgi:hypothetical protein